MTKFEQPTPQKLARDRKMLDELIGLMDRMGGTNPDVRIPLLVEIAVASFSGLASVIDRERALKLFADIERIALESAEAVNRMEVH